MIFSSGSLHKYTKNVIDDSNQKLIGLYKGFRGDAEDLLTSVSANGESAMNIISTLSFLLESSDLNQILLNLMDVGHES